MGVDLQIQVYILAALLGGITTLLIFFLAAICGNISKLKRQNREFERYLKRESASYDNHAFSSPSLQPDEELSRRGYSMYPYTTTFTTNSSKLNNRKTLNNVAQPVISSLDNRDDNPNILNGHETPDASSESINDPHPLSNGVHASTSNAVELKEIESNANYPPQFHGIPPPPAFVNHFNEAQTNDEQSSNPKSTTHQT